MQCANCHGLIEADSRFCRHCGATQPSFDPRPSADGPDSTTEPTTDKKSKVDWTVVMLAIVVVIVILVAVQTCSSAGDGRSSNSDATEVVEANTLDTPGDAQATPVPQRNWSYWEDQDKVRGAATYFASTTSTNSVYQNPPYESSTTMQIVIRKSPAYGTDIMLVISSGQMMCPSYEGCSGTVRFDDGEPQRVSFNGPTDNSSDTVFVVGAKSFITKLKRAKRLIVEKTLYEAGNPQFEFDVEGLKWDH